MKKIIAVLIICIFSVTESSAQLYMTRTGYAGFYSKTPMEDIDAKNQQLFAVINIEKKELAFMVLMKGFNFKKELMQTHFNENDVESDKYPKASFNGTYTGDLDIKNGAVSNIKVKGSFTLHGVTKPIEVAATLQLLNGILIGNTAFKVIPEDYNINVPLLLRNKIAREIGVEIKVNCNPKN